MRASEVIAILQKIISTDGDINVGFCDMEYSSFQIVNEIKTRKADHNSGICSDDDKLGDIFIGID